MAETGGMGMTPKMAQMLEMLGRGQGTPGGQGMGAGMPAGEPDDDYPGIPPEAEEMLSGAVPKDLSFGPGDEPGAPGTPAGISEDDYEGPPSPQDLPNEGPAIQFEAFDKESQHYQDLSTEYDAAKAFWQKDREKWRKLREAFLSYDASARAGRTYIPKTLMIVRNIVSNAQDSYLSVDQLGLIEPYHVGQANPGNLTAQEQRAELGTSTLNLCMDYGRFREMWCRDALMDSAIDGAAVLKCGWYAKQHDENGSRVTDEEYPIAERVNKQFFYPDPNNSRMEKARFTHEDILMSREEVSFQVKGRLFDASAAAEIRYGAVLDEHGEMQSIRDIMHEGSSQIADRNYCYITESWHYFDFDGNGDYTLARIFWIPAQSIILGIREQKHRHGRIPYVVAVPFPRPDSYFGLGFVEMVYALQNEYNRYRTIANDNASEGSQLTVLIKRTARIDMTEPKQKRGIKVVKGDFIDENNIRDFQPKSNLQDLYTMMQYMDSDFEQLTSVGGVATGASAPNTAWATQTLQQNIQRSFNGMVSYMNQTGLQPLLEMMWSDIQQFLDTPIVQRVAEGDPGFVTRELLQGKFKVSVGDVTAAGRRGAVAQALMTGMNMALQGQLPADYGRMWKVWAENVGLPNPDSYMPAGVQQPGMAGPQPMGGVPGQPTPNSVPLPTQADPSMSGGGAQMPGGEAGAGASMGAEAGGAE